MAGAQLLEQNFPHFFAAASSNTTFPRTATKHICSADPNVYCVPAGGRANPPKTPVTQQALIHHGNAREITALGEPINTANRRSD